MTFKLEIITPERIAFNEPVEMVVVPSKKGALGILPRHASLFAQLIEGEVKIKTVKEEFFLAIGGGFVEVLEDKVIILVTKAVKAQELNEQEILKAKEAAYRALKDKPIGKDLVLARSMLRQSIVDLRILQKRIRRIH